MPNKNKHHATTTFVVAMFINIALAVTACADDSGNREWTKEYIRSLIGQSTNFPMSEGAFKEWARLKNEVDDVAQILMEILDESSYGSGDVIANTLSVIAHSKNNHELFTIAITKKLESFKDGTKYDMESLKRSAERTLGIFKQAQENANTKISIENLNPIQNISFSEQKEPSPSPTNTIQTALQPLEINGEAVQPSPAAPPAQPEKAPAPKPFFLYATIALLVILGGLVVWRKKS